MKTINSIEALMNFLGIKPGDTIEFTGSQHYRDYELEIDFIPKNEAELKAVIETASQSDLQKMGVCVWTSYELQEEDKRKGKSSMNGANAVVLKPGDKHYLFPGEWYNFIPFNFPVVDIFGECDRFDPAETSNDIRFGCLSFGFIRNF